jgi:hypothetical protein
MISHRSKGGLLMGEIFNKWPNWLRWTLLLPVTLISSWVCGNVIFSLTSSQAATPDAPVMHAVWFASIVASHYVAFVLLLTIAPNYKSAIGYIFLAMLLAEATWMIQEAFQYSDYQKSGRILGKLVVVVIGWKIMREPVLRLRDVEEDASSG